MSDIQFTQGEDVALGLTILDGSNNPIDITGDTFDAKIKNIEDIDTELVSFAFNITDGPAGKVTLTLTDVQTLTILPTVVFSNKGVESPTPDLVLFYDVFRTDHTSTLVKKLVRGLVKVYPCMSFDGA